MVKKAEKRETLGSHAADIARSAGATFSVSLGMGHDIKVASATAVTSGLTIAAQKASKVFVQYLDPRVTQAEHYGINLHAVSDSDTPREKAAISMVERLGSMTKPEEMLVLLNGMSRTYKNANALYRNINVLDRSGFDEDHILDLLGALLAGPGWGMHLHAAGVIAPVLARKAKRLERSSLRQVIAGLPLRMEFARSDTLGSLEAFTFVAMEQGHSDPYVSYIRQLIDDEGLRKAEVDQRSHYYGSSDELFASLERHLLERGGHLHAHDLGILVEMQAKWQDEQDKNGVLSLLKEQMLESVLQLGLSNNHRQKVCRLLNIAS